MKLPSLAAVLVAAPALAGPGPADPAAAVPPPVYRSVFGGSPGGVEPDTVDWKKANAAVAEFPRGHVDLLKWEAQRASAPEQPSTAPARPRGPHGHQH